MMKSAAVWALIAFASATVFASPLGTVHAQELHSDVQATWKARVVETSDQEERLIPGTDTVSLYQRLTAELLEGERKGETVSIENDYLKLEEGDVFFLDYLRTVNGDEIYTVRDVERRPAIIVLAVVFAAAVIALGGKQGVRSLLSLAGSLLVILYALIPSLAAGYPPVLTSVALAAAILFMAIYFTHGFNRESTAAFLGTVLAVIATGALAWAAVGAAHLTGFAEDESVFLNLSTRGTLDIAGLLLAAIIIGVLGVLDDIAITQASVVRELYASAPHLSRLEVYRSALRVGKEHVSALVNTLALAYTGAALPLLLFFHTSSAPLSMMLNYEIFATEVVRTVVGSMGLILTVPLSTGLAVWLLEKRRGTGSAPAGSLDNSGGVHAHVHGHAHS